MEISAVRLDKAPEAGRYRELLSYLPDGRRERIRRYHRADDALRALSGDILARRLVCGRLKIRNDELAIALDEYGKPFAAGRENIHFNVSHSGKWVVCCVDALPVGIDIELVKPVDIRIAERFFSRSEQEALLSKKAPEREAFFYELWTLKESYIKALGKGLSEPLDSFSVDIGRRRISVRALDGTEAWFFKRYCIDSAYKMAVCARSREFPPSVRVLDFNGLYEAFHSVNG